MNTHRIKSLRGAKVIMAVMIMMVVTTEEVVVMVKTMRGGLLG